MYQCAVNIQCQFRAHDRAASGGLPYSGGLLEQGTGCTSVLYTYSASIGHMIELCQEASHIVGVF